MKMLNFGHFSVLILNVTSGVEIQIYDEAVKLNIFPTFVFFFEPLGFLCCTYRINFGMKKLRTSL